MAQTVTKAAVEEVVDTHFGISVTDPYRYMEDFHSPQVQSWVKAQAEFTHQALHNIPGRDHLLARIMELDAGTPYQIWAVARQPNGDLFYFKRMANEGVAKVCFRDAQSGQEKVLIDPELFSKANPQDHFSISFFAVAPNGKHVLYGYAASGSEQTTLKIFDQDAGRDLPESIDRLEAEYAHPAWLPDGRGFVYSRRRKLPADAPPTEGYKFTQAFLHQLGDDVERDQILFAAQAAGSPELGAMDFPAVILPHNTAWAIGQVKHGDETDISLYVTPLAALGKPDVVWKKIAGREDLITDFAVHGDDIYLLTAHDAPRFKVVKTSLANPSIQSAATVIPASQFVVNSLHAAQDALYVGILQGVPNRILRLEYAPDAQPIAIELPADEPSGQVAAVREDLPGIFVHTSSWTKASKLYAFDPGTSQLTDTKLLKPGEYDAPAWLTSTEVMVASHDGVQVPLSIIYRRDIKLDGSHPTMLSGYGAYGHVMHVHFDATSLGWLERGGVIAVAHVRGSGTFGKEWHHAGRKLTKPNTWKDFIACAEYLVKAGYTMPSKLAGRGGSAGGILIGRAITTRPDLFAAAQIAVGCTDMMRFETTLNGPPNVPEFGTMAREDECRALWEMSTLHHIEDGVKYPGVILTHGINDPRVEPWMSAKTTARFQAATGSGKPVLFRVDYHAGHGIGSTRQQRLEEMADVWSFFLWQFGEPEFQPKK